MDRAWLARRLEAGASYEELAREVGCSAAKIAYWAKKHRLRSEHVERHSARGGISDDLLRELIARDMSVREIAAATSFSPTTIRFWIQRYGLQTLAAKRRAAAAASGYPEALVLECRVHGNVRHFRRGSGYRCGRCSARHVSERRRRVKRMLVGEAGGCCVLCGYERCVRALEFHHRDPSTKSFALAHRGLSQAIDTLRAEAAKCVLLCSNCHAEVEDGLVDLPG